MLLACRCRGPVMPAKTVMILTMTAILPLAMAQTAPPPEDDPLGPPTQRGIRLTPELVRTFTGVFTKEVLVRHYELDEAKADEAAELVARRVMETAHKNGAAAQALAEWSFTQILEGELRAKENGGSGSPEETFTPEFFQGLAERALPLVPAVRDLVRDVGQDVRPMLSMKQQLKMGAEFTMAGTAMDVFEQNMQRWARGEGQLGGNPFADDGGGSKDANGQTKSLRDAQQAAQQELDKEKGVLSVWNTYLVQFKKFYQLNEGECATADSIFREFTGRLKSMLADARWRENMYQARMWLNLIGAMQIPGQHPFREMINKQYQLCNASIDTLGDEYRARLEQIPTAGERNAAEGRMMKVLEDQGFKPSTTQEVK